jgi:hypothetical protein
MDFETWTKFLGKTQDDPDLKAALLAAGVKKIPKLDDDETFVQIELKGHGLELILTDEASLRNLQDQDLGEGPLIVSGVLAKLGKSQGRDLYTGVLPSGITAAMSQTDMRRLLGNPTESDTDVDIWKKDGLEVSVDYTKDGASLTALSLMLPNAL